jgi:hypothetical protein
MVIGVPDSIISNWYLWLLLALAAFGLIALLALKGRVRKIKWWGIEIDVSEGTSSTKAPQFFSRSDSAEFAAYFEERAKRAHHLVLIGTGLNIIQRDPLLVDLLRRVRQGKTTLEIYLANPFSRAIGMRLVEEEMGDMEPPVGKAGLIKRLKTILAEQVEIGASPNFVVRLFDTYPTFAMFIIDKEEYIFYPYGYAKLGNFSPVVRFSTSSASHQSMIAFLDDQYERIKNCSIDARTALACNPGKPASASDLIPLAVFLIPAADSDIYQFGSKLLGYDIRKNEALTSRWESAVGGASNFGFHVTVADVLYFAGKSEVEFLQKEIECLASELRPFKLTFFLRAGFPNAHSVALMCEEQSGVLETLHHELVGRVYADAAASEYSLGRAKMDRGTNADRNILNEYRPHFTLLTALEGKASSRIVGEVEEAFRTSVSEPWTADIASICLMARPERTQPWQIAREIPFGRR